MPYRSSTVQSTSSPRMAPPMAVASPVRSVQSYASPMQSMRSMPQGISVASPIRMQPMRS